ncbi:hypothetical protein TVAG_049740 [Trichomonas vaginalis G3]|uniref:Secretory carrier membrane protein n=1 Tax=Trichomonas vaginalis (strain ATCC PRA-98 / G3) TaxID=412133 RepID=A2EVW9_TRIV3|nr:protein transport [Trichomonas vaginalis G3]EAY03190.1 hypothetical protein TVAG_049740 [Trichomonas vaginalis G3]KAI5520331.1 protein transport [Trichomonas vaginalis G3]|eukprot:XP_001315413.1 hypothetical protein [Trichomonas vaginalis G3]
MGENPFIDNSDDIELPDFENKPQSQPIQPMKANVVENVTEIPKFDPSTLPLDKKARLEALKAREAELLAKQKEIQATVQDFVNAPNWPSIFPLVHYDPQADLPPSSRDCIQKCLYTLILYTIFIIHNLFAILCVRIKDYQHIQNFIFACIQGLAGSYVSINFIYNGLYSACQKRDIPFRWTVYHFLFIAWCVYLVVGFPSSGSVGLATFLDIISKSDSTFSKFVAFFNSALAGATAFYAFLTLSASQKYQKVSGQDEPLANDQEKKI